MLTRLDLARRGRAFSPENFRDLVVIGRVTPALNAPDQTLAASVGSGKLFLIFRSIAAPTIPVRASISKEPADFKRAFNGDADASSLLLRLSSPRPCHLQRRTGAPTGHSRNRIWALFDLH